MASLNRITNGQIRNVMGTMCLSNAGFSIDASTENVETDNAVNYMIGGKIYNLGAQSAIDVSAATRLVKSSTQFATEVWADAAAAGGFTALQDDQEAYYVLVVNASGTLRFIEGAAADLGEAKWPEIPEEDWCPIGAVHVKNETGTTFTFGTTGLDTSGVTDTFYDLGMIPSNGGQA